VRGGCSVAHARRARPAPPAGVCRWIYTALVGDLSSLKTFRVEAHVGRKVAAWPFGSLDIGDQGLTVRSSLLPWIRPRSASRHAIGDISIHRQRRTLDYLRFTDSAGALSGVRLVLPVRPQRIVDELRSRGYSVTDRRKEGAPRAAP